MTHNLDPNRMFVEMALRHRPKFHFEGSTKTDFDAWRVQARPVAHAPSAGCFANNRIAT